MDWILPNLPQILLFLGIAALAIEIMIFGFATFVLFYLGIGCTLTGIFMYIGLLPNTLTVALVGVAITSFASVLLLWKPMQKLQNNAEHKQVKSDLIGYSFTLEKDISPAQPGQHRYSGISWQVKSDSALAAGTEVEVVKIEVGVLGVTSRQENKSKA
jgi:inner membrane protein